MKKSVTSACLFCLTLAMAPVAPRLSAAEPEMPAAITELARLTVVSARLVGEAKLVAALGRYGFMNDGYCMLGASMAPKQSLTMRIPLKAGQQCLWFAAGDDRAEDVDLKVVDPDGKLIGVDQDRDPTAAVEFQARTDGKYEVTITLFRATGTSFCGLLMMEADGWSIPFGNLDAAFSGFVRSAGATALLVHGMSGGQREIRLPNGPAGWCLFGTVLREGQSRSVSRLTTDQGTHIFVAVGCQQATDIDLQVTDDRGRTVVEDIKPNATPLGIAVTDANRTYDVTTSLPEARGAALTLTGILKVESNPNGNARVQSIRAGY